MPFVPLSTLIPKTAAKYALKETLEASWVVYQCTQILNTDFPQLASSLQVSRYKNKILTIQTQTACVAQEIKLNQANFAKALKQKGIIVNKISLKIGSK